MVLVRLLICVCLCGVICFGMGVCGKILCFM